MSIFVIKTRREPKAGKHSFLSKKARELESDSFSLYVKSMKMLFWDSYPTIVTEWVGNIEWFRLLGRPRISKTRKYTPRWRKNP